MTNQTDHPDRSGPDRTTLVLVAICIACALPELLLTGADLGFWGGTWWRRFAYANGGFWAGLLHDWQPNYRLQPLTMFFSYGFLHGGMMHLVLNMLTLFGLGRVVADRRSAGAVAIIFVAALLGGALGFAMLSRVPLPMVGASGALFGLAGAITWQDFRERRPGFRGLRPVMQSVLWLILLNIAMWWAMDGLLAWQTHLGGFLAGALVAAIQDRRRTS